MNYDHYGGYYTRLRAECGQKQGTFRPRRESNPGVIFLSTDHHQILASDREELLDALINELDLDDDVAMRKLAAACLGCGAEDVAWVEV